MDEFTTQKIGAPFNMALNTLERIGEILREIKRVSIDSALNKDFAQTIKINLVKQLYIQSTPLLPSKDVEDLKTILDLKPNAVRVVKNKGYGLNERTNKLKDKFDPELDLLLDNYTIEIQLKLQAVGYFMPPKNDPSLAVGKMN